MWKIMGKVQSSKHQKMVSYLKQKNPEQTTMPYPGTNTQK